jgi:large subunit ribosomal protein L15
MNLADVNRGVHKHKKRKRVGRGPGSGHGKTSGRGHKGQGQLAGWSAPAVFEGGTSPLIRRIPKRGFHNAFAKIVAAVNVGDLEDAYSNGDEVTLESLRAKNLAKGRYDVLKILGDGELTKKLKVSAHRFSAAALEKIKKAGGEANQLKVASAQPAAVQDKPKSKKPRAAKKKSADG